MGQKKETSTPFEVDPKYKIIRRLGEGAYGVVCSAQNKETGENLAIKKVMRVFDKPILAKRALREIKLLRHFSGHENIISILDMEIDTNKIYNEIYLVQELMEADMHVIIRSGQPLTDAHFQYFVYQICRGLKYIHSANVLHRDLKPGNLLVNADCELKICDFGLARGYSDAPENNAGFMTEYVATRWYRAPEIMLSFKSYTKAIDMWSVGCIFAEMLGSRPLFKGADYIDQLNQILNVLGTPSEAQLKRVGSERAQGYIRSLPKVRKVPFTKLYEKATPQAIDLLEKLLAFDPTQRLTVEDALAHPYLEAYHDVEDEPAHERNFDFSFERVEGIEDIRNLITQEYKSYKVEKQHGAPQGNPHRPAQPLPGPDRNAIEENVKPDDKVQPVAANADNNLIGKAEGDEALERELAGGVVV